MNKNTRRKLKLNRKETKTHNQEIVSKNTNRNMKFIVLRNVNENGKCLGSASKHVPIDPTKPCRPYTAFQRNGKPPSIKNDRTQLPD